MAFDDVYLRAGSYHKNPIMKHTFIILPIFLTTILNCYSQTGDKTNILYDGLYVAKTGSVPAANLEIFTYLLFDDDGSVYLQSVSSNDPQAVSKWFGRNKKFSQKGTYQIDGINIVIRLNNKDSKDIQVEGLQETRYKGTIKQGNQLCLIRDAETSESCFIFSKSQ
jgi:hypothetical protein